MGIDAFNGFLIDVPDGVDVAAYTAVVVWCEAFSQFGDYPNDADKY